MIFPRLPPANHFHTLLSGKRIISNGIHCEEAYHKQAKLLIVDYHSSGTAKETTALEGRLGYVDCV